MAEKTTAVGAQLGSKHYSTNKTSNILWSFLMKGQYVSNWNRIITLRKKCPYSELF